MIPLEKEKQIRALLKTGLVGPEISRLVGVRTDTVYAIRRMVEVIAELTPKQRKHIKTLLNAKVPIGAIEMQIRIPKASINAVRRYYFLHPERFVESKLITCPACGATKIPEKICAIKQLEDDEIRRMVTWDDAFAMYRIIENIVALSDSGIIVNPLFFDLISNARAIVEKINAESKANSS